MKIALLGFGTVGRSVYELLTKCETPELKQIKIKRILVKRDIPEIEQIAVRDYSVILQDPDIDTVVEVMGGNLPAYDYAVSALLAGKNVVTANKAMLCRYYAKLAEASAKGGGTLLFEASCAGGIPWISSLIRAKQADQITRVGGIMNGTANYILDLMQTEGMDPELALGKAQMKGFAEADPSDDIDGFDTARKIAISANLAFDICMKEDTLLTAGIRHMSSSDVAYFKSCGFVCRLVATACKNANGGVYAITEPMLFKRSSPMASVSLNNNYVFLDGRTSGRLGFFGQGAGGPSTANAVVQDLVQINSGCGFIPKITPFRLISPPKHRYYIRAKSDLPKLFEIPGERTANGKDVIVITPPIESSAIHELAKSSGSKMFIAGFAEDEMI